MNQIQVWGQSYLLREWIIDRVVRKHFNGYFGELTNKLILEIGCGSGKGAKVIKKYFHPRKIIGIDLDSRLVTVAKRNNLDSSIFFEEGDAAQLKFNESEFDAVFDFCAIHHIPGPQWKDCLDEACRVLKPGGKLFVYDVSIEYFTTTLISRILKHFLLHPYDSMYKRNEFIDYLEKLNFKIIQKEFLSRHFVVVADKQ